MAAWIKAETGVGPSIASGNQVCKINCADFPIAPMNKKTQIVVIRLKSANINLMFLSEFNSTKLKSSEKFNVPNWKKIRKY